VRAAFEQAWPAFALVAGLLLIGAAAAQEGVFTAAGAAVSRAPGDALSLLAGLLFLEAVVTALLNLDTAVVFMTPVLLHAARSRGLADGPFLYGAVFMANAAPLLLPGSNLTNVVVLAHEHVSGTTFAAHPAQAWTVSVVLTIGFVAIASRSVLRDGSPSFERPPVVLSVRVPPHPRALLLGLNLGPNLAVSGALSSVLWYQVTRANGARPSLARYTRFGVLLVPLTVTASLLVTHV
jgi:Na+/H+ antiporter NhaD/arsenite permease-like protein